MVKLICCDFALMAQFWLTDNPICDIYPEPDGDEVIDIYDATKMLESWSVEYSE